MADALGKILERIPYAEGAFRRRLVAGGLLLLLLFVPSMLGEEEADLVPPKAAALILDKMDLTSPVAMLTALIVTYSVGTLVEVLADTYVAGLVGGVGWGIMLPTRLSGSARSFLRYIKLASLFPVGMVSIYWFAALGCIGKSPYREDPLPRLKGEGQKAFLNLPDAIKEALSRPFSNGFEKGWRYLVLTAPEDQRQWLIKLEARNRDILAISTSLLVAFLLAFAMYYDKIGFQLFLAAPWVLVMALYGYFMLLRQSILDAIELRSLTEVNMRSKTDSVEAASAAGKS